MAHTPETVSDLIRQLGGRSVVTRKLGLVGGHVGNWQRDGLIPARRYVAIDTLCREHGFEAPRALFGFDDLGASQ